MKGQRGQKKTSSLPAETVEYLKAWMMSPEHIAHPYPTEQEKAQIMADTGIELKQLTNWFVNNRKRFWKPRVEARLQQHAHVQAATVASNKITHVVSPAVDRRALAISRQATTPIICLDMTTGSTPTNLVETMEEENGPAIIPSQAFPSFMFGAPRAVSDASSSVSDENGSITDSQEDMENDVMEDVNESSGLVTRSESVDVHILRPIAGGSPAIEDVSVLSSVPSSRVLRTYHNCMMIYNFPFSISNDRRKVSNVEKDFCLSGERHLNIILQIQSRRDAEVVRIKKHFLREYLKEISSPSSTHFIPASPQKRKREEIEESTEDVIVLRPKYAHKNEPATWRSACIDAAHHRCSSLPSLEEAAHLFGYSQ
jgi:hypothetical protein